MSARCLIVNADDFGQSHGINRGIITAHERGVVTSASLMVRWPASEVAAWYAREHPELSVGLHADCGEWAYRSGAWVQLYEVASTEDERAVAAELGRQIDRFRLLVGRDPTHLDSHQHVHRSEPARSIFQQVARDLGIPLRDYTPQVRYRGDFYGQTGRGEPFPEAIQVDHLVGLIGELPAGIVEIGCHPGVGDDLDTMYRDERRQEVAVLCDPRVRQAIEAAGVRLMSYADLRAD